MPRGNVSKALLAGLAIVVASPVSPVVAQGDPIPAQAGPTFADLADLADSASLVARVQIRNLARVTSDRATGLRPGHGRFYVMARTRALLTGSSPIGESVAYLVDLPLDARGKPPSLKKKDVFLFARPVAGRPGELQLVSPDAQLPLDAAGETRLRGLLQQLAVPDAPAKVTGVREAIHVPGNLAGQGETQIFLNTIDGSAASIAVRHEPGATVRWGVSFSELVADVGNPPAPDTLGWYRLACFLPDTLPASANLSESSAARRQADADYRMIVGELGACPRSRK
ncbi:MAG TPA: hypothetical protein VJM34_02285 [Novosphingobium sp.]|nr:hypothetical protein [Novosphingobium sp.]